MNPYICALPFFGPFVQAYHERSERTEIKKIDSGDMVGLNQQIKRIYQLSCSEGTAIATSAGTSLFVTVHAVALARFYRWPLVLAVACFTTSVVNYLFYSRTIKWLNELQGEMMKRFQSQVSRTFNTWNTAFKDKFEKPGIIVLNDIKDDSPLVRGFYKIDMSHQSLVEENLCQYSVNNRKAPDMWPKDGKTTPFSRLTGAISNFNHTLGTLKGWYTDTPKRKAEFAEYCKKKNITPPTKEDLEARIVQNYKDLEKAVNDFVKHNYVFS